MILSKSVSQICGNYITSFCLTSRIKIITFGSAAFISPIESTWKTCISVCTGMYINWSNNKKLRHTCALCSYGIFCKMFLDFRERRSVDNGAHSLTMECICLFLNNGLTKITTRGEGSPHWSVNGQSRDRKRLRRWPTRRPQSDDPFADPLADLSFDPSHG